MVERWGLLLADESYWRTSRAHKDANCNGCGTKGWKGKIVPDTIYGLPITDCCNIHDWEYGRGTKINTDKPAADSMFLHNMLSLIEFSAGRSWLGKLLYVPRCYRAFHVYAAVRLAGTEPFKAARLT